ncbi:hypothetical protein EMCG_02424 [[Emmonsia] crescens]|uniref:Uncharacterized protein n=1 Tax=[Emmonsia] crescens TaxID=73230 RepID=A0A0G2J1H2_9EURO|nr:hypothetical protein EMCG_02424 [Emmonsia crescens UAMH 3008]
MPSPHLSPAANNAFGEPNQDGSLPKDPRKSKPDPAKFDPVRSLEEFASHVASIAAISGERERLRKRSQAESAALRKASDRNFQYPSIAKRLKTGKKELDNELATVDGKLQIHQKMQEELIKELAANFNSGQQEAQTRLELEQLKKDLRETKADIKNATNVQDGISATLNALKSSTKSNEEKIAFMEQWRSSAEAELKNLRSEFITNQDDRQTAIESTVTNHLRYSIELKGHQQQQTFDSSLKLIRDERESAELSAKAREEDFSKRLDNLDRMISEHGKAFKELGERTDSLMHSHSKPIANGSPTFNTSAEVMNQIQNLRQVQEAKDEAIADELDKYESRVACLEDVVTKLKQKGGRNETHAFGANTPQANAELEQLREAINRLNQYVENRFQHVENQSRTIQAHQIALHSLETRYNHLSTEPIVQQMVVAMQEMYPHASIVQQEIPNIQEKTNKLISTLNSVRRDIGTAENARTALINDITTEKDRMTEQISSLRTRIDELGSHQSKVDELEKTLRSRMDDVENVVATNLASVLLNHEKRPSTQHP